MIGWTLFRTSTLALSSQQQFFYPLPFQVPEICLIRAVNDSCFVFWVDLLSRRVSDDAPGMSESLIQQPLQPESDLSCASDHLGHFYWLEYQISLSWHHRFRSSCRCSLRQGCRRFNDPGQRDSWPISGHLWIAYVTSLWTGLHRIYRFYIASFPGTKDIILLLPSISSIFLLNQV